MSSKRFAVWAVCGAFLLAGGCGDGEVTGGGESSSETVGTSSQALTLPAQTFSTLKISLPNHMPPQAVAIAATGSLRLNDRAKVQQFNGKPGVVVSTGTATTYLGCNSETGDLWSRASVDMRPRAHVHGDLTCSSTVHFEPDAEVERRLSTNTSILPYRDTSWTPTLPTTPGGAVSLEPDQRRTINPGKYGAVSVKSRSTLTLKPGVYRMQSVTIEPQATLALSSTAQPTILYVDQGVIFRGRVLDVSNPTKVNIPLLVVSLGNAVLLERPFNGTVYAPNGKITLSPGTFNGAFIAKDVELAPDVLVRHYSFPWNGQLPPRDNNWRASPVQLDASIDANGVQYPDEQTANSLVDFTIPGRIRVSEGIAGNALAEFQFRNELSQVVTCTYRGGSSVPHPNTDYDRMLGRRLHLQSCDHGYAADQAARGNWFSLHMLGGDSEFGVGKTGAQLVLGGGCSGVVDSPVDPAFVTLMRENFDWDNIRFLQTYDTTGRPALWHGFIYVERPEQLQALDRMHIYWSSTPLLRSMRENLVGKCGRVEHASDWKGVMVYAIFPSKFFNIMKVFGQQAKAAGIDPPFRFIIPAPPDDRESFNPDGSLTYQSLVDSGYREWLARSREQQPNIFEDGVEFFEDAGSAVLECGEDVVGCGEDVGEFFVDTGTNVGKGLYDYVLAPAGGALIDGAEILYDYAAHGFNSAMEWAATAVDDTWETVQDAGQDLAALACGIDYVWLDLTFEVANLDDMFRDKDDSGYSAVMRRMWGPPGPDGKRPKLAPSGTYVMLRQWGCGFIPALDERTMGEDGRVSVRALQGSGARGDGDGLCIELDAHYGLMSSDLVADEICNFNDWDYWTYDRNETRTVIVEEHNIANFTQLKDSHDYVEQRIGYDTYRVKVLTGDIANTLSGSLPGEVVPRALCLNFPGTGVAALETAAAVAGMFVPLAAFSGAVVGRDIWWPDNVPDIRRSRGVMTHEYGHFNMCSMLYDYGGTDAINGLLARLNEGSADARTDEISLMTETMADEFAMQVVGGSNYIRAAEGGVPPMNPREARHAELGEPSRRARMGYCVKPPCLDMNYVGLGDCSEATATPFMEELARMESLVHDAFDSNQYGPDLWSAWGPWNGDAWTTAVALDGDWFVREATSGYSFIDDDPVNLTRPAWRAWIQNWLTHGVHATKGNVLAGLADTMTAQGFNWCDKCEVFAAHHGETPEWARMDLSNPNSLPLRTFDVRAGRFASCAAQPDITDLIGEPPDAKANIDAFCQPCPPHATATQNGDGLCAFCPAGQIAVNNQCVSCPPEQVPALLMNACVACGAHQVAVDGQCENCPAGQIALNNQCVPCPSGHMPMPIMDVCLPCGAHQVAVDGQCVDCPPGTTADHDTDTCVVCAGEVTIDWATVPQSCDEFVLQSDYSVGGTCGQMTVDVIGLDTITARGGNAIEVATMPRAGDELFDPFNDAEAPQVGYDPATCTSMHNSIVVVAIGPGGASTFYQTYLEYGTWGEMLGFCNSNLVISIPLANLPSGATGIRVEVQNVVFGAEQPGVIGVRSNAQYAGCEPGPVH